ncbi:MAG: hypothetical protein ACOCWG_02130, partial [bacterium]
SSRLAGNQFVLITRDSRECTNIIIRIFVANKNFRCILDVSLQLTRGANAIDFQELFSLAQQVVGLWEANKFPGRDGFFARLLFYSPEAVAKESMRAK